MVMTSHELAAKLLDMPDKLIHAQVVANDGTVWDVNYDFTDIESSWMIQLKLWHKELETLPKN